MNSTSKYKEEIKRYLLGEMSEAEQSGLEKEYFADPERFEEVCAGENDLIDGFVAGRLQPAERDRFERHYLSSKARRQKVAFARSLVRAASAAEHKEAVKVKERTSLWGYMFGNLRSPALAIGLSMAVALIAALWAWAVIERARLRTELGETLAHRQEQSEREKELENQIAAEREQNDRLAEELERLRRERESIDANERDKSEQAKIAAPAIASFILSPGLARAGSETPKLEVPARAALVQLQINFEGDEYKNYLVEIKSVEGARIWSQRALKARKTGEGAAVFVKAPANKLAEGDYILALSGVKTTGEIEEVNRYFFRIDKR